MLTHLIVLPPPSFSFAGDSAADRHVHVLCDTHFIATLIARCQVEIVRLCAVYVMLTRFVFFFNLAFPLFCNHHKMKPPFAQSGTGICWRQSAGETREDHRHRSGGNPDLHRRLSLRASGQSVAETAGRRTNLANPLFPRRRDAQEKPGNCPGEQ